MISLLQYTIVDNYRTKHQSSSMRYDEYDPLVDFSAMDMDNPLVTIFSSRLHYLQVNVLPLWRIPNDASDWKDVRTLWDCTRILGHYWMNENNRINSHEQYFIRVNFSLYNGDEFIAKFHLTNAKIAPDFRLELLDDKQLNKAVTDVCEKYEHGIEIPQYINGNYLSLN